MPKSASPTFARGPTCPPRWRRTARPSSWVCSGSYGPCRQRAAAAVPLTPAGEQARNPRFSPDGERARLSAAARHAMGLVAARRGDGRATGADDVAVRRARAGLHARWPRRRLRDRSHGPLLPLVDHAGRRRRNAIDGRDRHRIVSDRIRARAHCLRPSARRRVVDPRASGYAAPSTSSTRA